MNIEKTCLNIFSICDNILEKCKININTFNIICTSLLMKNNIELEKKCVYFLFEIYKLENYIDTVKYNKNIFNKTLTNDYIKYINEHFNNKCTINNKVTFKLSKLVEKLISIYDIKEIKKNIKIFLLSRLCKKYNLTNNLIYKLLNILFENSLLKSQKQYDKYSNNTYNIINNKIRYIIIHNIYLTIDDKQYIIENINNNNKTNKETNNENNDETNNVNNNKNNNKIKKNKDAFQINADELQCYDINDIVNNNEIQCYHVNDTINVIVNDIFNNIFQGYFENINIDEIQINDIFNNIFQNCNQLSSQRNSFALSRQRNLVTHESPTNNILNQFLNSGGNKEIVYDKKIKDNILSKIIFTNNTNNNNDTECVICKENFNEKVGILECTHKFCENCIKSWIDNNKNKCPICRHVISEV